MMSNEEKIEKRKARQRAYAHEVYIYYKEHHICTKCRREEAEKGKTMCLACRIEHNEYNRKYNMRHREELNAKVREKGKRQYQERKEQGICTRCGRRKAEQGKVKCAVCLAQDRKIHEKSNRKKGAIPVDLLGKGEFCYTCSKPVNGTKLCADCQRKAEEALKIARAHRTKTKGWHAQKFLYGKMVSENETSKP